jgi:hypothetical protein
MLRPSFLSLAVATLACVAGLTSCSRKEAAMRTEKLGTPTAVGPLTYTAIESEWRDDLQGNNGQRLPKNRFLIVHLSIANGSNRESAAPLLQLVDAKGNSFAEATEGDGVPEWLGYLRLLQPRETRSGRILFDVPPGAYKLRVSSGGDPETEQAAFIELPLQFGPDTTHVSGAPSASGVEPPAQ